VKATDLALPTGSLMNPFSIAADLTVPVVRAAVARQAAYDAGKALAAAARARDEGGLGAQWAGQGAPAAPAMPAAALVRTLAEEFQRASPVWQRPTPTP
jgi:hypothetical protein